MIRNLPNRDTSCNVSIIIITITTIMMISITITTTMIINTTIMIIITTIMIIITIITTTILITTIIILTITTILIIITMIRNPSSGDASCNGLFSTREGRALVLYEGIIITNTKIIITNIPTILKILDRCVLYMGQHHLCFPYSDGQGQDQGHGWSHGHVIVMVMVSKLKRLMSNCLRVVWLPWLHIPSLDDCWKKLDKSRGDINQDEYHYP